MTAGAAAPGPRRPGGAPLLFFALGFGGIALGGLAILAQVLGGPGAAPGPTAEPTAPAAAVARARGLVETALARAGLVVTVPTVAYRPAETPELLAAPRAVLQAALPQDPQGGYLVLYAFPSATEADRAGGGFLAYVTRGTGQVQYPAGTRFTLRRVGAVLVLHHWTPEASPDPRAGDVATALETVGEPVAP